MKQGLYQGDQIGRNIAPWVIVHFGQFGFKIFEAALDFWSLFQKLT
jgi:hypothetical protein